MSDEGAAAPKARVVTAWGMFRTALRGLGDDELGKARDLLEGEIERRAAVRAKQSGAKPRRVNKERR